MIRLIPRGLRFAGVGLALFLPLCGVAGEGSAEPGGFAYAGTRLGISENPHVRHAEAFTDWQVPGALALGGRLGLKAYVSGSLGWLGDDHNDTVTGSLGPSLRLTYEPLPVALVFGSAPTFLGRNNLGGRNLGCAFQFTSHVGLMWEVIPGWELGYRAQHISNAGIGSDNPGLNSHFAVLAWRF
jgi:hypothetical protein